jgi:hypothetical protein
MSDQKNENEEIRYSSLLKDKQEHESLSLSLLKENQKLKEELRRCRIMDLSKKIMSLEFEENCDDNIVLVDAAVMDFLKNEVDENLANRWQRARNSCLSGWERNLASRILSLKFMETDTKDEQFSKLRQILGYVSEYLSLLYEITTSNSNNMVITEIEKCLSRSKIKITEVRREG